jgi:protein SCO1/2
LRRGDDGRSSALRTLGSDFLSAPFRVVLLFAALLFVAAGANAGFERLEVNEPAPAFALVNQDGRRVTLSDFAGKVVVITFLYTSCTDVCPVLVNALDAVGRRLSESERERVRFIGISVDPARDTPPRLKGFIAERGLDEARWELLTGTLAQASKTAADYGVVVRPAPRGDFVHNSVFVLVDARGVERVEFHGMATPQQALLEALRALLAEPAAARRK